MTIIKLLRGRLFALFLFGGIFVSLAFGQLGLFNTGEIPFPSQEILSISKIESNQGDFYKMIEQIAKENKIRIYRTVIEGNKNKGFVFGTLPEKSKQELTQNTESLTQTPPVGAYFIDGKLSQKSLKILEDAKVKYILKGTGWENVATDLLLGRTIRTQTFYITLLLFTVTLYSLYMAQSRKSMIARTVGASVGNILPEILSLTASFLIFGLTGAFLEKYFDSTFFPSLILLLAIILGILLLLVILVHLLFRLFIYSTPIIAILKNKVGSHVIHYLWLLVIALSIGMMTQSITNSFNEYNLFKVRERALKKWEALSDFSRLWVKGPEFSTASSQEKGGRPLTKEEKEIRTKERNTYNENWRSFDQSVAESDKIFIKKPRELPLLNIQGRQTTQALDFNNPQKFIQLENQWISKVWEASPSVITLSQKIIKENPKIFKNEKPVTIYIPEKYKEHKDKILPVVTSNFVDSGLKLTDFDIIIIPDNFQVFVPLINEIKDSKSPEFLVNDGILAQYDTTKFPNETGTNFLLADKIPKSLYRESVIAQALVNSKVKDSVSGYQNPFAILKNYQNETEKQIQRTLLAMITLFIAQIFVLYEFSKLRLSMKAKKIAIGHLNGQPQLIEYLKVFALILGSLLLGLGLAFYYGSNSLIISTSGITYLLLTFLLLFIAHYQIWKKGLIILKGEGEIL